MELLFHIQTPLGILLKSEMSYADMISILEELHKYVPVVSSTTQTNVPVDGEVEECTVIDDKFHRLLFGGDQLTTARARGAQRVRSNSERPLHKLEGFEPVCEDWHVKGVLLRVCALLCIP